MHKAHMKNRRPHLNLLPVVTLAVGHGIVDVYGSFISPLLPLFAVRFNLSLTLVGTLVSVLTVADGLSQPLFGYWGDRMRRPWMPMIAVSWVALTTGLLGVSTGYAMLAFLLILSGVGRSAYHPQGAAAIAEYGGGRRALSLSIFISAGNLGFATGPILATAVVAIGGLSGTLYALPLGVVATGLLYAMVFRDAGFRPSTWTPPPLRAVLGDLVRNRGNFTRLWFIVVLRSLTYFSFFSFLPIIFARQGLSMVKTGIMTSTFLFGCALGGIAGGWLSDHLGERPVIAGSLALALPTLELALMLQGAGGIALLIVGGLFLLSSAPVTIALGQRYAPGSVATASSLMLGLGWGTGGLLVTLVGIVADRIGPVGALRIEILCLIVAVILALGLSSTPKPRTSL